MRSCTPSRDGGKTELRVEKKPIKACNKNDKRLFIKQETEKVNIYHFGFYLVDLENSSGFTLVEQLGVYMKKPLCFFRTECSHIVMNWLFFRLIFRIIFPSVFNDATPETVSVVRSLS